MSEKVTGSLRRLTEYCRKEGFKGYDPFDGLNSRLFQALPLLPEYRIPRLAWIQLFKRSPLNLRPFTGVDKGYNPKALGLFLSGYCNLYKIKPDEEYHDLIRFLVLKIGETRSNGYSGDCWGYNFDWQAKAFFQPKNTPTIVATSFIANALVDAYEITGDGRQLQSARSACEFILKDINRTSDTNGNFAFSYSPLDKTVVFNASFLGSRLLARVYGITHENALIDAAAKSARYCCDRQKEDGSWSYGTLAHHQWIDNFHTGYNLESLAAYIRYSGDNSFISNLNRGFDYYISTFFSENGLSKYYNNSIYPVDIHAPAQLVITVSRLDKFPEHKDLVDKVLNWTIENMQSSEGYFYYQKGRYFKSRVPYMRWAQAWMFFALSEYLLCSGTRGS